MPTKILKIPQVIADHLRSGSVQGYKTSQQAINAWGSEKFIGNEHEDSYGLGWLRFRVYGEKFVGFVRIILNHNDTYSILFETSNNRTGEQRVLHKLEKINPKDLAQSIDSIVEGEINSENK